MTQQIKLNTAQTILTHHGVEYDFKQSFSCFECDMAEFCENYPNCFCSPSVRKDRKDGAWFKKEAHVLIKEAIL